MLVNYLLNNILSNKYLWVLFVPTGSVQDKVGFFHGSFLLQDKIIIYSALIGLITCLQKKFFAFYDKRNLLAQKARINFFLFAISCEKWLDVCLVISNVIWPGVGAGRVPGTRKILKWNPEPGPDPGKKNFKTRNPARKIFKPGNWPGTRVSGPGRKTRPGPEFFFLIFFFK